MAAVRHGAGAARCGLLRLLAAATGEQRQQRQRGAGGAEAA
jgi:hypothetical protein